MVEGTLQIAHVRRQDQPPAEFGHIQPRELGHTFQNQVQLGGKAVGAETAQAPHEPGVEMRRTDQRLECSLRVGVGDDHSRRNGLATFKLHATGMIILDENAPDWCTGPDLRAE